MIVHDDYGGRRVSKRRPENFARMSDALVQATERNLLNMQKAVSRIEQNDPQRFGSQPTHLRADQFADQLRRIEFLLRQCLAREPFAQAKRRYQLQSFRLADAWNPSQFFHGAPAYAREGFVFLEKLPAYFDCVRTPQPCAQ